MIWEDFRKLLNEFFTIIRKNESKEVRRFFDFVNYIFITQKVPKYSDEVELETLTEEELTEVVRADMTFEEMRPAYDSHGQTDIDSCHPAQPGILLKVRCCVSP